MADKRASFSFVQAENSNRLLASVVDAPFKVKTSIRELLLDPPAGDLASQNDIANYGDEIRKALMAHPEIGSVLGALDKAPNRESWNLMFGISSPVGEAMRWEVLRNAGPDYLVLSAARRLFRVAADPSSPELGIRNFPNPLRFVACLSPAQIDSTDEFNGILAAVDAGRKAGLPLELVLYVGQRELVPRAPPWATCRLMPSSTVELQDELKLQQAHILHFFCHGQSELPQSLQFATVAEQRAGVAEGSVLLSMDRIVDAHLLDPTWIVVFNCCDGGRPGEALASMAYRAVAESGIPAAIGMGSPLPAGAAPLFSAALYRKLFAMLAVILPKIQNSAEEIDFGDAIAEARLSLHDAIAASGVAFSCWALPIIYLNKKPFVIQKVLQGAGPGPADPLVIGKRIATIAGMLQAMPTTTPREVRQQMVALFDQDPYVPPALRCDENGNFPIAGLTK
jgi:hypothetical protein